MGDVSETAHEAVKGAEDFRAEAIELRKAVGTAVAVLKRKLAVDAVAARSDVEALHKLVDRLPYGSSELYRLVGLVADRVGVELTVRPFDVRSAIGVLADVAGALRSNGEEAAQCVLRNLGVETMAEAADATIGYGDVVKSSDAVLDYVASTHDTRSRHHGRGWGNVVQAFGDLRALAEERGDKVQQLRVELQDVRRERDDLDAAVAGIQLVHEHQLERLASTGRLQYEEVRCPEGMGQQPYRRVMAHTRLPNAAALWAFGMLTCRSGAFVGNQVLRALERDTWEQEWPPAVPTGELSLEDLEEAILSVGGLSAVRRSLGRDDAGLVWQVEYRSFACGGTWRSAYAVQDGEVLVAILPLQNDPPATLPLRDDPPRIGTHAEVVVLAPPTAHDGEFGEALRTLQVIDDATDGDYGVSYDDTTGLQALIDVKFEERQRLNAVCERLGVAPPDASSDSFGVALRMLEEIATQQEELRARESDDA